MVAVLLMSARAAIGNVKASANVAADRIWVNLIIAILRIS